MSALAVCLVLLLAALVLLPSGGRADLSSPAHWLVLPDEPAAAPAQSAAAAVIRIDFKVRPTPTWTAGPTGWTLRLSAAGLTDLPVRPAAAFPAAEPDPGSTAAASGFWLAGDDLVRFEGFERPPEFIGLGADSRRADRADARRPPIEDSLLAA